MEFLLKKKKKKKDVYLGWGVCVCVCVGGEESFWVRFKQSNKLIVCSNRGKTIWPGIWKLRERQASLLSFWKDARGGEAAEGCGRVVFFFNHGF